MTRFLRILAGVAVMVLSACAVSNTQPNASAEEVACAAYRHDGPPAITLFTMINNRTGAGAHTSLMINGSQRVIFDPAGTVRMSFVPERGDVLYGITPAIADFYTRAHARETYHVVIQRIEVSPAVAEQALQLAMAQGSVASAQCAVVTSGLLRQLPGFGNVTSSWFPKRLMESFEQLPGVTTTKIFENDDDDKAIAVAEFERLISAEQ